MKSEILNILKNEKPILEKEFGVEEIGVFGSVARNTDSKESDIDIMVKLQKVTFSSTLSRERPLVLQRQSRADARERK